MSRVHIVKVSGKSIPELIKGLHAAIAELEVAPSEPAHKVEISSIVDGDEMEEVESPYSGKPSIVIDNEKDSEGLPWDNRIHSGGKSKNNDGTWKKKKGVDAAEVVRVKAELLNRGTAHVTPVTPSAPVNSSVAITNPSTPVSNLQPALPTAALPQVQTGHTLESFKASFALIMSNLISQGKLTQEYVNTLKGHFGVAEIWQASGEQIAACFSEFVKCGLIQQVG